EGRRRSAGRLRAAGVAVMQAAEVRDRTYPAFGRRFYLARLGRVIGQGRVGARLVIVSRILPEDPPEVPLVQDQRVIQTLAPAALDPAFHERIRVGRHRPDLLPLRALPLPDRL